MENERQALIDQLARRTSQIEAAARQFSSDPTHRLSLPWTAARILPNAVEYSSWRNNAVGG
jgi:hypothetical protein